MINFWGNMSAYPACAHLAGNDILNAEKVNALFADNGQTSAKWAGMYAGGSNGSKKRRLDGALRAVKKTGRLYDDPLPTPVVEGICLDTCRQLNELEKTDKLVVELDLVREMLSDLHNAEIESDHEWADDVLGHDIQPRANGQSNMCFARDAVIAASRVLIKYKGQLLTASSSHD